MNETCDNPTCFFKDLTRAEAEEEIEKIAVRGARAVLKELGLEDEYAGADVRSLRDVLQDWRRLKKNTLSMLGRWLGIIALGYLTIRFGLLDYFRAGSLDAK